MASNPGKLAHARLTALAQRRRRFAKTSPGLPEAIRRRLHEEVARRNEATPQPHPSPPSLWEGWRHWRALLAWLGVGAAAAVLVFVVRFPEAPGPMAARPQPGADESAAPAPSAPAAAAARPAAASSTAPADPSAGIVRSAPATTTNRALQLALRGLGDAALPVDPGPAPAEPLARSVPAPVPASALASPPRPAATRGPVAEPGRSRARVDLGSAQRLRQSYHAVLGRGTVPAALAAFDILRSRDRIEVHDTDGSVYVGRVNAVGIADTSPATWSFEVHGFSRTLGRSVAITGNFGGATTDPAEAFADDASSEARTAAAAPVSQDFLQLPLTATVLVEGSNPFEVHAIPVVP